MRDSTATSASRNNSMYRIQVRRRLAFGQEANSALGIETWHADGEVE
ncbi:hypothetical protein OOK58_04085 [Streptomyces sp. NBC_01728]|nr:hypothetical protein [Streptomyces sp. NBC_01728]MCX4461802.1 hypothetical protein [Streptomyces sp. NBC_01719]MCX4490711.1 hypothetical protein [Streptomyces sp. NBC_01728]